MCMCIDYRALNSHTVPDQCTTTHIDEALDCLSCSQWFSVLDLRSGYYQIPIDEEDKEKTAFICPLPSLTSLKGCLRAWPAHLQHFSG